MNPFSTLSQVQDAYRTYVQTFQQFENPVIDEWVSERVSKGTLLWRDPHLQLARRFKQGDPFRHLVARELLHPDTPRCFTVEAGNRSAAPIQPYKHQSEAVTAIQSGHNTIVATGTGSGKSFTFGIPIVSDCLGLRNQGVRGIKAIIIYPMNALANSQYDDFARRLAGSGLKLALYTGDTFSNKARALEAFREITGRSEPFDSEIISREEIREELPDILMTNYVMLELLLTRFEDRILFPTEHREVLKFLVLDEVHTYTGSRGSDVACLIRRLKQHTGTTGTLRCIATSATVQSGEDEDGEALIADFAQKLFGESFSPEHVIGESYVPLSGGGDSDLSEVVQITSKDVETYDGSEEQTVRLAEKLLGRTLEAHERTGTGLGQALSRQATLHFLEHELAEYAQSLPNMVEAYIDRYRPEATSAEAHRELTAALLIGTQALVEVEGQGPAPRLVPKLHAFFSQGRGIMSCLTPEGPHLNDRGELTCPTCAQEHEREQDTFPLVFCRSCGHEYYSVALSEDGTVHPNDLGGDPDEGVAAYLFPGHHDTYVAPIPDNWLTGTGNVKKKYREAVPVNAWYNPTTNTVHEDATQVAGSDAVPVTIIRVPLLLCPHCALVYDRRPREYSKLFTFGTVGRSTATDILVSNTMSAMPEKERKVIAFSDNRQDTALQASHMNSLQRRLHFRRGIYQALQEAGEPLQVGDMGYRIFNALKLAGALPAHAISTGRFKKGGGEDVMYQRYLEFALLMDLERTHRRIHQNLEDVGLLKVTYNGLDLLAEAEDIWRGVPVLGDLDVDMRYDYVHGFLDIMRKHLAIGHPSLLRFRDFQVRNIDKLRREALFEEIDYYTPCGFSDDASTNTRNARIKRFVHPRTTVVAFTRRALSIDYARAQEVIPAVVECLSSRDVQFLATEAIRYAGELYMLKHDLLHLSIEEDPRHRVCPRCGTVHHFRALDVCTGTSCGDLRTGVDLSDNYFRLEYSRPLKEVVRVEAAEHSGQVSGQARRRIEEQFREEDSDLNVIVCTPTMELGIDIGDLSTVYMRNVPPSPSNYAQRAGRAGRKGQASLITVFCGAGTGRGPHDQYFYRYPEKIIAGKISPPRFLLDNERLILTHIHALVLETLSHRAMVRLPYRPLEILNINQDEYPLFPDLRDQLSSAVDRYVDNIVNAVCVAFADEMREFDWLTESFIGTCVQNFVARLDQAFQPWRTEYRSLSAERDEINRILGGDSGDKRLQMRRRVIEARLDSMRKGSRDFYTYRYLGSQGFLPNYAFPRNSVKVTFYDRDDQLSRDPVLALREYAPGNFIYYSGSRYEVTYGRPPTRGGDLLVFEKLLICPKCETAYFGSAAKRAACGTCEASLRDIHPIERALAMPDMVAMRNNSITSDEEERMRKGFLIERHYQMQRPSRFEATTEEGAAFGLTYEHNGQIVALNRGPTQNEQNNEAPGFHYCRACNTWLLNEKAVENHVGQDGKCPQNARPEDIIRSIHLFTRSKNDVVTVDCPLPNGTDDPDTFYTTLLYTLQQALSLHMDLADNEIDGFVGEVPEKDGRQRIVLYETAEGGTGAVKALTDSNRLKGILRNALELLHVDDEGCERACYECLCTFYNQHDHARLDRHAVLPFLQSLNQLDVAPCQDERTDHFQKLLQACESNLERAVLHAIQKAGLPLPDGAQKTIYDGDVPVAEADFYYEPRHVVFVDGAPHEKDYVEVSDHEKRRRLKQMGYRITAVTNPESLDELKQKLGAPV